MEFRNTLHEVKGIVIDLNGKEVTLQNGIELVVDWDGRQNVKVIGFQETQDEYETLVGLMVEVENKSGDTNCVSISDIQSLDHTSLNARLKRLGYTVEEIGDYLEELRKSGEINMYGATPYMIEEFSKLDNAFATEVLLDWMKNYNK